MPFAKSVWSIGVALFFCGEDMRLECIGGGALVEKSTGHISSTQKGQQMVPRMA
jgi:hypothetical protein